MSEETKESLVGDCFILLNEISSTDLEEPQVENNILGNKF